MIKIHAIILYEFITVIFAKTINLPSWVDLARFSVLFHCWIWPRSVHWLIGVCYKQHHQFLLFVSIQSRNDIQIAQRVIRDGAKCVTAAIGQKFLFLYISLETRRSTCGLLNQTNRIKLYYRQYLVEVHWFTPKVITVTPKCGNDIKRSAVKWLFLRYLSFCGCLPPLFIPSTPQ